MRRDPVATRPRVEGVAEDDDSLAGDRGTPDATEQLLRLAGEHRSCDDLDLPARNDWPWQGRTPSARGV